MKFILFICCAFIGSITVSFGEESDEDSVIYITDYSNLLAFRIYTNTKWNVLDIIKEDQRLRLQPNGPTSIGVGFNYKDYGFALAFGLPKSNSSNEKYGKTKRFDFQMSVYSSKFGFDGFAQLYKGYYMANPEDFIDWESEIYPQLPDMQILSLGLNAFYLFNHEEFSYKAAFVRNQIQRKSAGSFTLGLFGHIDDVKTDNGFIPTEFPDSLRANFDLKSFSTMALGISVGYLYTWVISDHFFLNVGINPGFGNQTINLENLEGVTATKNSIAGQFAGRSALGYDSRYFYMGITGMVIWRNFQYKGYELDLATEQFRVFIGKRFDVFNRH